MTIDSAPRAATDDTELLHEFQVLLARAGLELPPDRRDVMFDSYLELRAQIELVWRGAPDSPSPSSEGND